MAITATDSRDRGRPSSWSAAVDALAAGVGDERKRLFMLSAGRSEPSYRSNYPNSNFTDGIHDPAQAWNALTVGGYTDKALVDARRYPNWAPLAPRGDLSPSSCTSITWGKWPLKPDIVLEAGNMATNSEFDEPDYIDDGLLLLTTHHQFSGADPLRLLVIRVELLQLRRDLVRGCGLSTQTCGRKLSALCLCTLLPGPLRC